MANNIKFENNAPKVRSEFKAVKEMILIAIGEKVVNIWTKVITREKVVDTGRFRASTAWIKKNDNEVAVGSNLEYSTVLEIGGVGRKARPTLRMSLLDYKDTYRKIAENLLKNR